MVEQHASLCCSCNAVLPGNGPVLFIDLAANQVTGQIPCKPSSSRLLSFSMDARANIMAAACSDGKLRLFDLAAARAAHSTEAAAARRGSSLVAKSRTAPRAAAAAAGALPGRSRALQPLQQESQLALQILSLEDLHRLSAHTFSFPVSNQSSTAAAAGQGRTDAGVLQDASNTIGATSRGRRRAGGALKAEAKQQQKGGKAVLGAVGGKQLAARVLDMPAAALNRRKLQQMLLVYGEFPARYRVLIW